jgi:hypothetical protein
MILDCDPAELDGGTPTKSPRPPFRILADYGELTDEDRERGLELLLQLRPRRLRPLDIFGPNAPSEAWRWPMGGDELTLSLVKELANPRTRGNLVGEDVAFWAELLEAAERRAERL